MDPLLGPWLDVSNVEVAVVHVVVTLLDVDKDYCVVRDV